MKTKRRTVGKKRPIELFEGSQFLFRAGQKVSELGVVGEKHNTLAILLACISRMLSEPVSVMGKGTTGSGKTKQFETCTQLFPPACVMMRAGLSEKALAYGKGSLAGKILFINEYRCGRDAQQLLRLLQSDREIQHEAVSVMGSRRRTDTAVRSGAPVVLTTTTDEVVYADDESRFLSVYANEGAAQTRAILVAKASAQTGKKESDLPIWRKAMSMLRPKAHDFRNPPDWLRFVAEQIPCGNVGVRRNWSRALSFCQAIALCRRPTLGRNEVLDITLPDYCVGYKIFEPILAGTIRAPHSRELELARAVAHLNSRHGRPASPDETASELGWKRSLVYKYAPRAVRHRLIQYEPGTRASNLKRLVATLETSKGFLPHPRTILEHRLELGPEVRYVNPFSGKTHVIRRHHRNTRVRLDPAFARFREGHAV